MDRFFPSEQQSRHVYTTVAAGVICILLLCGAGCRGTGAGNRPQTIEAVSAGFNDPPPDARPGAFWCWLNGNMTREAISRDLREMHDKGMGRAEIWDVAAVNNPNNYIPAGPAFLSDSSVDLIRYACSEGERYGITVGMIGSSGWNAGGPWVEPDWASKQLYWSEIEITGPMQGKCALPFPEVPRRCPKDEQGRPLFYKEVAVLAVPRSKEKHLESIRRVIDLTPAFADDQLTLNLPEGDWLIQRYICSNNGQRLIVPSPKSGGLFIDFLDPRSTEKHLGYMMKRLHMAPGRKNAVGPAYIEFDSMELAAGIPWTDAMPVIFKKMRGYDLRQYLPVLSGWTIGDVTKAFLYDWKKTISDQLIRSHYITGREFLKQYGVDLVAEAGGPGPPTWDTCPVDALKALGNVTVPRGEFWIRHRHIFLVKEVASASHIYGRRLVDAESFTTWRRWKDGPYDLKKIVDRAFCEGLNCVTFHTFASTNPADGLPGRTYHAGSDINSANTWWNKSRPFMEYLSRCSWLLRQGLFCADVCYYYGDQAPNFYPAYHDVPRKIVPADLGSGYDYDVINSDVILHRMTVKNGRIVLPDGMSYRLLVLPDRDDMDLAVLRKLEQLVREGATVAGRKPLRVPTLHHALKDSEELTRIADTLWGTGTGKEKHIHSCGKGRVIEGMSPRDILTRDGIAPDFRFDPADPLDYIHRQCGKSEIYFIRNRSPRPVSGTCSFRVTDRYPEIWDPATGEMSSVTAFSDSGGRIDLDLDLDSRGSLFVVFTGQRRSLPEYRPVSDIINLIPVTGPWTITFPGGWGAPAAATFDSLISWTESDIPGIRYFSGTAAYHKCLTLPETDPGADTRIVISLEEVRDVAEVYINDTSAGIVWKPPYRLDITDLVRAGENNIRIEVVNQWVNRLTGDMLLAPSDRFCRTNQPYITSNDMGYDNWAEGGDETFRVQPSGLLGPVTIRYLKN